MTVSYLDEELKTQHKFLPRTRANMLIRNHQDLVGSPQKVFTFLQSLDTIWTHPVDRGPEVRYDNSFYTFRLSVIHSETVSNFEFNKMIMYCFQEELGERNPDGRDNRFKCEACDQLFPDQKKLTFHMECHQLSFCETCNVMIEKRQWRTHPCNNPTIYPCEKCDYTSSRKHDLLRHILKMHSDKFPCDKCTKTFKTAEKLHQHVEVVHRDCFKCEICDKHFGSNSSLKRHKRSHSFTEPDAPSPQMEVEYNVHNRVEVEDDTRQVSSTGCVLAIPPSGRQPDMVGAVYESRAQGQEQTYGTRGQPPSQENLYSSRSKMAEQEYTRFLYPLIISRSQE